MKKIFLAATIIGGISLVSCDAITNENGEVVQIESHQTRNNQENNQNNKKMGTEITFKGNPIHTVGVLPEVGTQIKNFTLTSDGLEEKTYEDFKGQYLVLNIFPSLDTPTCQQSVRKFNESASSLENTKVLCISKDLPFAQSRFCGAEGLNDVINLSDFRTNFGQEFGVEIAEGALKGLLSRAVIVVNPEGEIIHTEQVPEIGQEPNYEAALAAIK